MAEFRFTKPDLYKDDDVPGKTDPRKRQGYYITAPTLLQAVQKFKHSHPRTKFAWEVWRTQPGECPICGSGPYKGEVDANQFVHHFSRACPKCNDSHIFINQRDGSVVCACCGGTRRA